MFRDHEQATTEKPSYIDDLAAPGDREICKYHTLASILLRSALAKGASDTECGNLIQSIKGLCPVMAEYAEDLLAAYQEDAFQAAIIRRIHEAEGAATVLDILADIRLAPTRQIQAIVFMGVIASKYHRTPGIEERLGDRTE